MYATAYETRHGFGSVGLLAGISRNGRSVRVADPALGFEVVPVERCLGVAHTETGYVLPDVHPQLQRELVSMDLQPAERRVANQVAEFYLSPLRGGAPFPSGYPAAFEFIQHWRESVAVDWRTIALIAIFARTTIQRPIEDAERQYRIFGPTLRDALFTGRVPTLERLSRMRGIRARALGLDDARSYVSILRWAPRVAEYFRGVGAVFDRSVRDGIALEYLPHGLGLAKLSFSCMLLGRDAACIDTRMLQYFFGRDERAIDRYLHDVAQRAPGIDRGITRRALGAYRAVEDRLAFTPYFDFTWPQPYAKAQWLLWETLGRTAGTASHSALFEVLEPTIQRAGAA